MNLQHCCQMAGIFAFASLPKTEMKLCTKQKYSFYIWASKKHQGDQQQIS